MIFFCISSVVNAGVSTSIDRSPVRVNETFELTLHMESAPVSRPPLKGLPEELEIIRSSNFYQRSTINGKTETQAGWRFTIKAKTEGIFTIPAFNIDSKSTSPIQIKVLAPVSSTSVNGQQDAIQLKATVDLNDIYVQQQIIYTIRLYRTVQAQYASLSEPEMPGALLERLGEDRQFETEIDGSRYIVLERRYVIFPQQQGEQEISPVIFTAEISSGGKRYSTLGRLQSRSKTISLSTDAIKVNVKRQPKALDNWWLPATNVSLSEKWQPDPVEFRVGKPVTWSYTINADGLTATQVPELLPTNVDGLKFYPDTAQSTNQPNQDGMVGSRTQKIAVVPTRAGPLTIPELKLSWWDVQQDVAKEIILPARTIEVLPTLDGDYGQQPVKIKPPATTAEEALQPQQINTSVNDTDTVVPDDNKQDSDLWKTIALTSLLLWIILGLFLFLRKIWPSSQKNEKQQKQTKDISTSTMSDIKRACETNSPKVTKKAILNWCASQKGFENILSLADIYRHITDEKLTEQIKLLERHLYAAEHNEWDGSALSPLLKGLNNLRGKNKTVKKEQLPPLHPEN